MLINFLFLPALFLIGLITGYQDLRYGIIKNKWIILGLIWGLFVYFGFILTGLLVIFKVISLPYIIRFSYIGEALLNALIAFLAGYLLWRFNLWSAGDAKLFLVFSLLLPLKYYSNSYLPIFPSFALIINIFLSIFIFLVIYSFFFVAKRGLGTLLKIRNQLKENLKILAEKIKSRKKDILGGILGMATVFLLIQIVREELLKFITFNPVLFNVLIMTGLLIFGKYIFKFFKKPPVLKITIALLIIFLGHSLYQAPIETRQMLSSVFKMMIIFMGILGLFQGTVDFYVKAAKEKRMPFAFWMLVGVGVTMLLKGSSLSLIMPYIIMK